MEQKLIYFNKKLKNQKLLETEQIFQENKEEFIHFFRNNFQEICEKIGENQKKGRSPEICYLEYTMLYTNFINKKYIVEVRTYDDNWFLDKHQEIIGTFDVSFLFEKYSELWRESLIERNKYGRKVSSREITEYMVTALRDFFSYVVAICRFGILPCVGTDSFQQIKRGEEFEINVGEYMAQTEAIYKEVKNKDVGEIKEWFKERKEFEYAFEDYSGLNFSGSDLSEIDLRYSDFRDTNLRNVDLQDSMLFGTRFCNADMVGADLRYCLLYEADFTEANLQDAKFILAEANKGIQDEEEWQIVGYVGVSFRGADLRGTDFTRSSFLGADFTGAKMDGAIFSKGHVGQLDLTQEQRNVIIVK